MKKSIRQKKNQQKGERKATMKVFCEREKWGRGKQIDRCPSNSSRININPRQIEAFCRALSCVNECHHILWLGSVIDIEKAEGRKSEI
jgi:hypothetical protein